MKKFLVALFFVLTSCTAAPAAVELPTPLFADGTSFSLPCQEHGSHLQTITDHTVGIVYTIVNDAGETAQVPEELVKQVLDAFGINPNEESGQQTPADQVEAAPGDGGRCSGPDVSDPSRR